MMNAKAAIGKKRSATTQIKSKPAKAAKKAQVSRDLYFFDVSKLIVSNSID